jgi:hypothetical protein
VIWRKTVKLLTSGLKLLSLSWKGESKDGTGWEGEGIDALRVQ